MKYLESLTQTFRQATRRACDMRRFIHSMVSYINQTVTCSYSLSRSRERKNVHVFPSNALYTLQAI